MTHENYLLFDLDSLLSNGNFTEDDFLQLPELLPEEPEISPSKTPLSLSRTRKSTYHTNR